MGVEVSVTRSNRLWLLGAKTLAIVALVLSAVFLHRMADFSAQCFHSQLVDRFIIFSKDIQEIPHCGQRWSWGDLSGLAADPLRLRWPRVAAQAERLFEVWPAPPQPFQMVVVTEDPFLVAQQGSQFLLGASLADSSDLWLRELVRVWVGATTQGLTPLEVGVLADFLAAVARDQLRWTNWLGQSEEGHELTWAGGVILAREYCLSPWREVSDLNNCESDANQGLSRGHRRLLARGLWEIYQMADWQARRRLWIWLREKVALGHEPLLAKASDVSGNAVQRVLSRWLKVAFPQPALQTRGQVVLRSRLGLSQAESPAVVVEFDRSTHLREFEGLVRMDQHWQWWTPTGQVEADRPRGKPSHWVKVGCHPPSAAMVANLAQKTFLFIEMCEPRDLQGGRFLTQGDLRAFLAANPNLGVFWLDARALAKTLSETRPDGQHDPLSLKRLRLWSHWREDTWDRALAAFRSRAAVDLILSHRATRDLL